MMDVGVYEPSPLHGFRVRVVLASTPRLVRELFEEITRLYYDITKYINTSCERTQREEFAFGSRPIFQATHIYKSIFA